MTKIRILEWHPVEAEHEGKKIRCLDVWYSYGKETGRAFVKDVTE